VNRLHHDIDQVRGIRLTGAPETILFDETALFAPDGDVSMPLLGKLRVLIEDEGMQVVVLSRHPETVKQRVPLANLVIVPSIEGHAIHGPLLAIVASTMPLPPHAYAWYVGAGDVTPPFHATGFLGSEAANEILGLFGTALLQERAGIAFRAAGSGKPIPAEASFNSGILDGIARTVQAHPQRVNHLKQVAAQPLDLDGRTADLIASALAPILESQAPSGAVAAAPPPAGPDAPNYWFFWQRDAGNVVVPLSSLLKHPGYAHLHDPVQGFIDRYIDFVERLPHGNGMTIEHLGVSRFDMHGNPIESYGNPQKDGPSHTILAVLAALGESARAHAICTPYLEYLRDHINGPTFDPWEFAVGNIFNDDNLARRALRSGAALARSQGEDTVAEGYDAKADDIERTLAAFQRPEHRYISGGRDFLQPWMGAISGLDSDVVGSVLDAYDVTDTVLNVDDPRIGQTMEALEKVFADRWPVNIAWRETGRRGMGIGRFPEDTNDGKGSTGGNPWTFATLWAAEYYLRLIQRHTYLGTLDPSKRADLLAKADGYLTFVLEHGSPDSLTEQIDGQTGKPRGAKQLAWAQAELINVLLIREEVVHDGA
jgi:hypothetical protein